MGLSVLNQPAAAGGGIKSVQRGSAAGSGNVTITAVDITKSFVTVFGTTSSGTVAASAAVNGASVTLNSTTGTNSDAYMKQVDFNGGQSSNTTPFAWDKNAGSSGTLNGPGNSKNTWVGGMAAYNFNVNAANGNTGSANLSGGTNNLVAAVVQGYLSNSTTLVVSGACRWEVVEFN